MGGHGAAGMTRHGADWCSVVYHEFMPVLDKPLRQSVTLPSPVAWKVKRIAKTSRVSTSRVIADLVQTGLRAQEQERRHFSTLVDRLAGAKNANEKAAIKAELARLTFGP